MKFRGGYNILLQGRPEGTIKLRPEPEVLYLPLHRQRFSFGEVCVEEGQQAKGVLAIDRALPLSKSCLVRIVSISGTGVKNSTHISVMPGYPIQRINEF